MTIDWLTIFGVKPKDQCWTQVNPSPTHAHMNSTHGELKNNINTGWWFQTMQFLCSIIYGMSSETHWRTPSFFKIVKLHHQAEYQWIGLRDNLQEHPIFNGKIYGFL